MTKAKSKIKKIILPIIAALAAVALIGGGLYLFLPGSWRPLNSFSQYQGLLDSPFTQIVLYDPADHSSYETVFSDSDLLSIWQDYLAGMRVKWSQTYPVSVAGGEYPTVTVTTQTGEYRLRFPKEEDGSYRLLADGSYYALEDSDAFPFAQTYGLSAQRHGEFWHSYDSSTPAGGTWLRLQAVSGYRAMFSAPWTAVTVSPPSGAGATADSTQETLSAWRDYLDQLSVQEIGRYKTEAQTQIQDGTLYELTVQTQQGSYSLFLRQMGAGEYRLEDAGILYAIRSDGESPLEELGG